MPPAHKISSICALAFRARPVCNAALWRRRAGMPFIYHAREQQCAAGRCSERAETHESERNARIAETGNSSNVVDARQQSRYAAVLTSRAPRCSVCHKRAVRWHAPYMLPPRFAVQKCAWPARYVHAACIWQCRKSAPASKSRVDIERIRDVLADELERRRYMAKKVASQAGVAAVGNG